MPMSNQNKTNIEWIKYKKIMTEHPQHFAHSKKLEIITDEKMVTDFENNTGKIIGVNYESEYHIMVVDLVYDGEKYFSYERLLPAVDAGAVVIVPICNGNFVLLEQFRHALRDYQYAFPRGFASTGLSAEDNCRKELKEELGCEAKEIVSLGTVVSDSGLSGDKVNVYLCTVDSYEEHYGHEGICRTIELTASRFQDYVSEGKINDGYTLSAYAMYLNKTLNTNKNI